MMVTLQDRKRIAARALKLVDLTNLADECSDSDIDALINTGQTPHGNVAALCVWPDFVAQAKASLSGSGIEIATVVNFPRGETAIEPVLEEIRSAVNDGADEIDLVWPYTAFLAGHEQVCRDMIIQAKAALPDGVKLKVILETGALISPDTISSASVLALNSGADFLKTSTGKIETGATLEAAEAMLEAIKTSGKPCGFKASGGVGTLDDAAAYLQLADDIMGPEWATPETFRFGASSLVNNLLSELDKTES